MITNKKIAFSSLALIALFSLALSASADTSETKVRTTATVSSDDEFEIEDIYLGEIDALDDDLDDLDKKLDDDLDDDGERSRGDEHRSDMADIIDELDRVAGRDSDIEDDIDEVVKEQRELEEKAAKALDEVEKRDSLRTFFFGTDYRNLGELRSTIVTTENHIERLQKASERTDDVVVKASLEAQIQALEDTASSTEVFIRDNEGKFSLFGWFVRIFK